MGVWPCLLSWLAALSLIYKSIIGLFVPVRLSAAWLHYWRYCSAWPRRLSWSLPSVALPSWALLLFLFWNSAVCILLLFMRPSF